jgi:predicted transcriptional regulator
MRRNSELMKSILSFMQEDQEPTQCCKDIENGVSKAKGHPWQEVRLHIALLKDMGLVTQCTTPAEYRLTSAGYDVAESADPIEQMKAWAKFTNNSNAAMGSSFATTHHPLPPAARSQRFS